jgi:trehalose 6-phosphate phosphatase
VFRDKASEGANLRVKGVESSEELACYRKFFDRLKTANQRVLLLDYDGTLAPFRVDRDHAFPYPGVPYLVSRIANSGTRVVLISGRRAEEVATLSGVRPRPEIWGCHGMERITEDGSHTTFPLEERQLAGLYRAGLWLGQQQGLAHAAEFKPGSVAAHWRGAPATEVIEIRRKILTGWQDLAHEYQLELLDFDGGIEIRVPGHDKGQAVATILQETGDAVVAYLGDDQTDEDAFRALKDIGEQGLSVLVRTHVRDTAADVWIKPPQQLIEFLENWLLASGGAER